MELARRGTSTDDVGEAPPQPRVMIPAAGSSHAFGAPTAHDGTRLRNRCGTHRYSTVSMNPIPSNVQIEVQTPHWLFGRDDQKVKIERVGEKDDDLTLVITANDDPPRRYAFSDLVALMRFQADMEEFLVTTGWSLLEFSPERRGLRDRRTFPRINERRRWWTDALHRAGQP